MKEVSTPVYCYHVVIVCIGLNNDMKIDIVVLCATSYENYLSPPAWPPEVYSNCMGRACSCLRGANQHTLRFTWWTQLHGDPCTTEQQVTAELRSNMDGSITSTSVAHKTPDTYEVSYQPDTRGRHLLNVTVNGEPVQGSPFLVYVRQAPLLGKPVRVITGLKDPYMIATTGSGVVVSKINKISFISRDGESDQEHWHYLC